MIAIVDYGMGNLTSVVKAFETLYVEAVVTSSPDDLARAERIVLPGVGAFGEGIRNLHARNLIGPLEAQVLEHGKPFLGICLGMELLATDSCEDGDHIGLGWVDGSVKAVAEGDSSVKSIHSGWNDVRCVRPSALLAGLGPSPDFYFVHGYHLDCRDPGIVTGVTQYGGDLAAVIERDNVMAVQFHPEKSQEIGLALLHNFLRWSPASAAC